MPSKVLKLLALLAIVPVAPATASRHALVAHPSCPFERAREMAAAARAQQGIKIATTVTLTDRLPAADRWLFGVSPGILNP